MKKYLPLLSSFAAATIFGFTMLFIKTGMRVVDYDAIKFLSFRFLVGFITMTLLVLFKVQKVSLRGKPIGLLLICGALNPMISQTMETSATTYAPTSQIAVISASLPVLTTLISFFINHEKPTRKQVFFMCLSVAGVMSINLISGQMVGGTTLGLVFIITSVVAVSTQRSVMRRATLSFTAFECVYIPTAIGAAGFTLISLISHISRESITTYFDGLLVPDFIIPILYMGICSSVIAFLCLTYAGANLPVAVSGSTGTLNTAITILVGVFVLGETLRPIDIVGIVVIMCGIIGISLSYDKNSKDGNRLKLQPMPKRR